MAEENKNENIVSEAPEGAVAEAMHDAPTKGAGKAEPMQKAGDYEDLGPAVTSPTGKVGQDKSKDKVKKIPLLLPKVPHRQNLCKNLLLIST